MKALRISEPENGWLDICFTAERGSYSIAASHVPNDCIRELVQAVARIVSGSPDERVRLSSEPGYATCHFQRADTEISLVVFEHRADGPAYEASFPLLAFARRLVFECKRIRLSFGRADAWQWPFPESEIDALTVATQGAEH